MKKTITLLTLALGMFTTSLVAQTNVDPSAALEIDSTTKGFLPPRMSTAQRNAISSPAVGLIIYNTTTQKLNFYNGSSNSWEELGNAGATNIGATAIMTLPLLNTTSSNNSLEVQINNTSLSMQDYTFTSGDISLTGVGSTGVTIGTPSPASSNLAPNTSVTVEYPINSLSTSGTLNAQFTFLSLTASNTTSVKSANTQITDTSLYSHNGFTAFSSTNLINTSNSWHVDSASAGAYILIDLGVGNAKEILRIDTSIGNGAYVFEYSDDNVTFTTIQTGIGIGTNSFHFSSLPRAHRYWRLRLTNTPGGGNWSQYLRLFYE